MAFFVNIDNKNGFQKIQNFRKSTLPKEMSPERENFFNLFILEMSIRQYV